MRRENGKGGVDGGVGGWVDEGGQESGVRRENGRGGVDGGGQERGG